MSEKGPPITIRPRKFIKNPLLKRKQFVVDIIHPGRGPVSKEDLTELLCKMYKVKEPKTVVLFGFRTGFGGGKSTGFCSIYDNLIAMKKYEPKYRQIRMGFGEHKPSARKSQKEDKNKQKKVWGTGRRAARRKASRSS